MCQLFVYAYMFKLTLHSIKFEGLAICVYSYATPFKSDYELFLPHRIDSLYSLCSFNINFYIDFAELFESVQV